MLKLLDIRNQSINVTDTIAINLSNENTSVTDVMLKLSIAINLSMLILLDIYNRY